MKTLYIDGNAGASGNMFLGALLSLGVPEEVFRNEWTKFPVILPEIRITTVNRNGISAIHVAVNPPAEKAHRHLSEIIAMIHTAGLSEAVTSKTERCFTLLAEAEGKVHGISPAEVHFHEVGAIDAIVDIVGTMVGLDYLQIDTVECAPLRVGYGTVHAAHGEIPLPAPATVELLQGFEIYGGNHEGEWVTPTGAALIKTFAKSCAALPLLKISRVGYGAGTAERPVPNVLRLILGENSRPTDQTDSQVVLETNIDDMNPEFYGRLGELLLENGAKDYFLTPVQMKKNRPGVLVTVITPPERVNQLETLLFKETTTLGIRNYIVHRNCLERGELEIQISGIPIRVKTAIREGEVFKFAPEYEDCLRTAGILQLPVKEIYDRAMFQARKILQAAGASSSGVE